MLVCCIGTFDSIVRRKEVKKVIWRLIYDMHMFIEKMPSLMGYWQPTCSMTHVEGKTTFTGHNN